VNNALDSPFPGPVQTVFPDQDGVLNFSSLAEAVNDLLARMRTLPTEIELCRSPCAGKSPQPPQRSEL
jgi:hypothetical protein